MQNDQIVLESLCAQVLDIVILLDDVFESFFLLSE